MLFVCPFVAWVSDGRACTKPIIGNKYQLKLALIDQLSKVQLYNISPRI